MGGEKTLIFGLKGCVPKQTHRLYGQIDFS